MRPESAESVHLLTEALKHAFADRAEYLGDTDFVDVPVSRLISEEYAAALAERIAVERTFGPEHYGRYTLPDDAGTSHFSIIDAHGNAVACTETINTSYGSYVVVPEYGIVLNNEMDDFTAVPGEPNAFGLIQSAANAVEPGKKPLSSMTPTILVRDGKAEYVAGASGGPRIITATLQALLNMTRHTMTPQEAVGAPRIHHQWLPDELLLEREFPDGVAEELEMRGHHVVRRSELAVTQAAARDADGVSGGSDVRKGGTPAGW
jgi:gamma-glutamyltranspeptidase/glutathione hydrolase